MSPRIRRTDLAIEANELYQESTGNLSAHQGIKAREETAHGFPLQRVEILDKAAEEILGKPQGTYITLTVDPLLAREEDAFVRAVEVLSAEISALLGDLPQGDSVLVVGLGNRAITPDAIGPKVHEYTMVTRHLVDQMPDEFGDFRPVFSLAAGVLGTTGVESGDLVSAITEKLRPCCVIAVDALASRSLSRVCRTVQLSDTGIAPGSGVGNHRMALNRESLGVPVIAIGVPTVVDAATLCADLLNTDDLPDLGQDADLLVTPKDIDTQISDLSKLIGYAINLALHQNLSITDVDLFLS